MASQPHHPEWMKDHPLLTKIGLKELNERGYINLRDPSIDQSFRDCPDDEIHAIFQRGRWSQQDLATMDWDAFRPTLKLASRLLQCDATIHYVSAMLDEANYGTIDSSYLPPDSNPNWFRIPSVVTPQNEIEAHLALNDLAHFITWEVLDPNDDPNPHYHGKTHPRYVPVNPPPPDIPNIPDVRAAKIVIATEYIDILCRGVSATSSAAAWHPGSDEESARLRCSLICAITMVHEIMHALGFVHGNWPHHGHITPPEPYYVDTRIAELGQQWQKIVFGPDGSDFDPILQGVGCSYGLLTTRWPGPAGKKNNYPEHTILKLSKRKYGHVSPWRSFYAVSMDWVQSLFTDAFWEEVERNGVAGLRPARKLGVRNRGPKWKWLHHEVKVPYAFVESPKSVLSEADDVDAGGKGIIDRHDFSRHISKKEMKARRSDQVWLLFYFFILTTIVVWVLLPNL